MRWLSLFGDRLRHVIHQRQPLPALIAVSYMGVEELGFLVGKVVLAVGVAAKMALAVSMLSLYAMVRLRGAW